MSFTLQETLEQIDPYRDPLGRLSQPDRRTNGSTRLDQADTTEYIMTADSQGRLVIHQLDFAGYPIQPPVLVEQKKPAPKPRSSTFILDFFPKTTSKYHA